MAKDRVKAHVVYGSYSGTVQITVERHDDLETIKARIRRQEQLNFLPMATYQVKILERTPINYEW